VTRFSERAYLVFSGLLLIVGSVLSGNGGSQHPTVSQKFGKFGSDEFFHTFGSVILSDARWEQIHAQILAAPVLWALGGLALAAVVRAAGETRWSMLAVVSMAMGAVLWVVSYVFDGFVSAKTAQWMLSDDPALQPAYTATFGAGQWTSIRTHFVAWALIALGTTAFSIALASLARRGAGRGRPLAVVLVLTGLVLGAYSLVAFVTGAYFPGPGASPWYVPALVGTQLWYLVAGILVVYRGLRRPRTHVSEHAEPTARAEQTPERAHATVSAS
jgi:hypothetical protein